MTLHEMANVAGFEPVLVMDVWQHELLLDYQLAQRAKYIEAVSQTLAGRQSKVGFKRDIKKPLDRCRNPIWVTALDSDLGGAGRHRAADSMKILELLQ